VWQGLLGALRDSNAGGPRPADLIVNQVKSDQPTNFQVVVPGTFEIAGVKEDDLSVARSDHTAEAAVRQLRDSACH